MNRLRHQFKLFCEATEKNGSINVFGLYKIDHFWYSESDVVKRVNCNHMLQIMNELQVFDKVNCNCGGLKGKSGVGHCTWEHGEDNKQSSRPEYFSWVERVFSITCNNAYSNDAAPCDCYRDV